MRRLSSHHTAHCILSLAVVFLFAEGIACSQNIYPDPGFETTGEPGVARTSQRSGHLSVETQNHWSALGGAIEVEPFARYRVTTWSRASVKSGTFFSPYCYDWDSYEWAFVSAHPIATSSDWVKNEVAFVCPHDKMYIHPLAYIDSEKSEAWVDDVVVEKIAEPAQVMAEIAAKTTLSDDEKKLVARWYVGHDRMADAAALLNQTDGLTRADIATVIALHMKDLAARRRFVVAAVAYGAPTYFEGVKRFSEMTAGMSDTTRLAICVDAAKQNPGLDRMGRGFRLVVESMLDVPGAPASVAEIGDRLQGARHALKDALDSVPAGSDARKEMEIAMTSVDRGEAKLAAHRKELGHCIVRIGGTAVAAATHVIVIPDDPTPQEAYAAHELQRHLELVIGEAIPVRIEKDAGRSVPLYVGACRHVRRDVRVDLAGLGDEGLHVKTAGTALNLAGNRRGAIYAVYDFLENNLGCRWFTPDCATWPRQGTIVVPALNRKYLPPLEYRAGDYPVARPGEFAAQCRLNGSGQGLEDVQGGKVWVHSLAHTFAQLVPPEKYFATHPEYFSLVNGKRQSGYAQLCLTNPDVLKIVIAGVRRWIDENPNQTVFSVSQNDTAMYCECHNCAAVAKEEGSQSGPILRFVNAVADAIRVDHPNIAIETLAYQYTRKPPAITRPHSNVIVCLCSIECCFIHPLGDDPFNHSFVEDIRGWSKICRRLWIWDYIINYAHSICPFPNLYVLEPNVNFFLKNGVRGIYEESCYYTKGSELQELRNYLMAKALWNPTYDVDKAIDEFCAAYYGAAAPQICSYIRLIHESTQQDPKLHVQIYTPPSRYITPEMIAASRTLFDQAEAAVKDDPQRLHRVQVARLPILYAEITLAQSGSWTERDDHLVQSGATDVSALADQFERTARAEGVTMIREGGPDASLDDWLKSIPRRPADLKIERLRNPALEISILPALGGRIWRMQLPNSHQDVLITNGSPDAWNPADGGYEEYSESGFRSPGWQQVYTVKDRSDRAITLEVVLPNDLRLARRIELDESRPLVRIVSTVTNTGSAPRTACLRVHPEFRVASTDQAIVRLRRHDGTWKDVPMKTADGTGAEQSLWLRGEDVPEGEWTLLDAAGNVSVANTIQREQVGQCLLDWSPVQKRVNLELYSPERQLAPGESIVVEQSYEVRSPAVRAEQGAAQ